MARLDVALDPDGDLALAGLPSVCRFGVVAGASPSLVARAAGLVARADLAPLPPASVDCGKTQYVLWTA